MSLQSVVIHTPLRLASSAILICSNTLFSKESLAFSQRTSTLDISRRDGVMSPVYSTIHPKEILHRLCRSFASVHFLQRTRYCAVATAASSSVMLLSSSFVSFRGGGSRSVVLFDESRLGAGSSLRMTDTVSKNAADDKNHPPHLSLLHYLCCCRH